MYLDAHLSLKLPAGLERDAIASVVGELAPLFAHDGPRERVALAVASPNAGRLTAVRFWSDARRNGLGLASPESFPWCLANAACGALARQFDVRGPSFTFLGSADALLSAIEGAAEQFSQRTVDVVVVAAVEFADQTDNEGRLFAFRLARSVPRRGVRVERGATRMVAMDWRATVDDFATTLRQLMDGTRMVGILTDGHRAYELGVDGERSLSTDADLPSEPEPRTDLDR